mgnify:CR=1 FL=1
MSADCFEVSKLLVTWLDEREAQGQTAALVEPINQ